MTAGILVLEGSDGTGKTTLARHLVTEHGATYIHHGWSKGYDVGRRFLANLRRAADLVAADELVVLDRGWLSSDAYGTVYRGKSDVPRRGRMLQRVLLAQAGLTVLCVPYDPKVAPVNHARLAQEREEMYKDTSAVSAWYDRFYDNAFDHATGSPVFSHRPLVLRPASYSEVLQQQHLSPYHYLRYDFTLDGANLEKYARDLLRRLAHHRMLQIPFSAPGLTNLGGYLETARVLLVGDAPGPRAGAVTWPFVSGSETVGCSPWLAEVMNHAGILEEDLAWVNAWSEQDILPAILEHFPNLRPVALGARAAERLTHLGVAFSHIEHPQFWKRFHRGDSATYGDSLASIIQAAKEKAA